MTVRYVCSAITAIVLACAVGKVAPLQAQAGGTSLLPPPDQSALVTVVGCLQLGGHDGDQYVLSDLSVGLATSVPEATCRPSANPPAIELEHEKKFGINEAMLGRWIEVSGRLEKETSDDPDTIRELHVRSFRMVPVIPPRVEASRIAPERPAESQLPAAERTPVTEQAAVTPPAPVGTSGVAEERLPKTAGELPATALIALLSLAGALGLHWFRSLERA
jgi:hypothetical protein